VDDVGSARFTRKGDSERLVSDTDVSSTDTDVSSTDVQTPVVAKARIPRNPVKSRIGEKHQGGRFRNIVVLFLSLHL